MLLRDEFKKLFLQVLTGFCIPESAAKTFINRYGNVSHALLIIAVFIGSLIPLFSFLKTETSQSGIISTTGSNYGIELNGNNNTATQNIYNPLPSPKLYTEISSRTSRSIVYKVTLNYSLGNDLSDLEIVWKPLTCNVKEQHTVANFVSLTTGENRPAILYTIECFSVPIDSQDSPFHLVKSSINK